MGPGDRRGSRGGIVPSGFEAYARVFHPGRRFFGTRWRRASRSGGPRSRQLAVRRCTPRCRSRRSSTTSMARLRPLDGDRRRGRGVVAAQGVARGHRCARARVDSSAVLRERGRRMVHALGAWGDLGPASRASREESLTQNDRTAGWRAVDGTWALRHYLVVRGPLDAMPDWFPWRMEAPNYWWPDIEHRSSPPRSTGSRRTWAAPTRAWMPSWIRRSSRHSRAPWTTASTSAVIRPTCHGRSHRRVASGQNDLRRKETLPGVSDGRQDPGGPSALPPGPVALRGDGR